MMRTDSLTSSLLRADQVATARLYASHDGAVKETGPEPRCGVTLRSGQPPGYLEVRADRLPLDAKEEGPEQCSAIRAECSMKGPRSSVALVRRDFFGWHSEALRHDRHRPWVRLLHFPAIDTGNRLGGNAAKIATAQALSRRRRRSAPPNDSSRSTARHFARRRYAA